MPRLTQSEVIKLRERTEDDEMAKLRQRIEAGDGAALLDAIHWCVYSGRPLPVWLAEAFGRCHDDYLMFRARTLDEAFGVATARKHKKIAMLRKRERLKAAVVLTAHYLHKEAGLQWDEELFRRVGQRLKISRSVANDIFYAPDNPWRKIIELWAKDPKFKIVLDPPPKLPRTFESPRQYKLPNI